MVSNVESLCLERVTVLSSDFKHYAARVVRNGDEKLVTCQRIS
jgi:hypothetical protein